MGARQISTRSKVDWGVALLIGNKARHADDLRGELEARFHRVLLANSVERCIEIIETEKLAFVLVDIESLIGAVYIAAIAAKKSPAPVVFAMYEEEAPSPEQTFFLGQSGVRELFCGPVRLEQFRNKLERAFDGPPRAPEISTFVANFVGHRGLTEFISDLRQEYLDQAIDRARGNKAKAARIAKVQRVIVQRAVAERPHRRAVHDEAADDDASASAAPAAPAKASATAKAPKARPEAVAAAAQDLAAQDLAAE